MYATSTAPKAALPLQASSDSSPGIAGSESDESWEDLGRNTPAIAEPVELSLRPKRWIPFSEGPRSCVGRALADMSMTGTLATLLARFHFRLADKVMVSTGPCDAPVLGLVGALFVLCTLQMKVKLCMQADAVACRQHVVCV